MATAAVLVQPRVAFGGTLLFANSTLSAIIDGRTGLPMKSGVAVAGLYYTTNLLATADPGLPKDSFELLRAVRIGTVLDGVFSAGTLTVPNTVSGQTILVQIRIWSDVFGSYEEAFNRGAQVLGSAPVHALILSGGTVPPTGVTDAGFDGLTVGAAATNTMPIARMEVTPRIQLFLGDSRSLILSTNDQDATVLLDGLYSSDPDEDELIYSWYLGQNLSPFATGVVASVVVPLGVHSVTLLVDDGAALAASTMELEVLSAGEYLAIPADRLTEAALKRNEKQALTAILRAARRAFDRRQPRIAFVQLRAFEHGVRVKLEPSHPVFAEQLIDLVRELKNAY